MIGQRVSDDTTHSELRSISYLLRELVNEVKKLNDYNKNKQAPQTEVDVVVKKKKPVVPLPYNSIQ